jgi:hypothetical protein
MLIRGSVWRRHVVAAVAVVAVCTSFSERAAPEIHDGDATAGALVPSAPMGSVPSAPLSHEPDAPHACHCQHTHALGDGDGKQALAGTSAPAGRVAYSVAMPRSASIPPPLRPPIT